MDDDLLDELMGKNTSNNADIKDSLKSKLQHYIQKPEPQQTDETENDLNYSDLKMGQVIYSSSEQDRRNNEICCLCGFKYSEHSKQRHGFFKAINDYRCKNCSKFFYQHDHYNNPCFRPYKYIGQP